VEGPPKVTAKVAVEKSQRGIVLGKGGETVKKIMELTGAHVSIPKSDDAGDIILEGEKAHVDAAKAAILELVKKGFSTLLQPGTSEGTVKVPKDSRSVVLGPKGANIKKIQDALGVKVNFPDRDSVSENVQIVGESSAVKIAKDTIIQILAEGYSAITHEEFERHEVEFPYKYRSNFIGQRGANIKSVEGNTTCKFKFPADETDSIYIVGPSDKIEQAKRAVNRLVEKLETPVVDVFETGFEVDDVDEEDW
jgi:transcription antitermination factor NusA-like protein